MNSCFITAKMMQNSRNNNKNNKNNNNNNNNNINDNTGQNAFFVLSHFTEIKSSNSSFEIHLTTGVLDHHDNNPRQDPMNFGNVYRSLKLNNNLLPSCNWSQNTLNSLRSPRLRNPVQQS